MPPLTLVINVDQTGETVHSSERVNADKRPGLNQGSPIANIMHRIILHWPIAKQYAHNHTSLANSKTLNTESYFRR